MEIVSFGKNSRGEETSLYQLENRNHMVAKVSDHGATLVSVLVPDKEGNVKDVVLGYDNASDYEASTCYLGRLLGGMGTVLNMRSLK